MFSAFCLKTALKSHYGILPSNSVLMAFCYVTINHWILLALMCNTPDCKGTWKIKWRSESWNRPFKDWCCINLPWVIHPTAAKLLLLGVKEPVLWSGTADVFPLQNFWHWTSYNVSFSMFLAIVVAVFWVCGCDTCWCEFFAGMSYYVFLQPTVDMALCHNHWRHSPLTYDFLNFRGIFVDWKLVNTLAQTSLVVKELWNCTLSVLAIYV